MRRIPAARPLLALLSLLALTALTTLDGCCGGYSVVRTSFLHRAELRADGPVEVPEGDTHVLHYSRLGEPPNTCSDGAKYIEDLWVQLPSLKLGETYTLGQAGVGVAYRREREGAGQAVQAKQVTGTVRIEAITPELVSATLAIRVVLPSGQAVVLDDEYAFHPDRPR